MDILSNLKYAPGSIKKRKRIGRGEGSGRGGTSTKGMNGQKSRAGHKFRAWFEGGQMPLQRRVPKFGFKNPNTKVYCVINLDELQTLSEKSGETVITKDILINNGLANKKDIVKILGRGELKSKLKVSANAFSASAVKAIESLGGELVSL